MYGDIGGSCTCPSGAVYTVGDNNNDCASLACVGGDAGTCGPSNHGGHRGVTCGTCIGAPAPPPPGPAWGIFPREYRNSSVTECPAGSRTATQEECWEAARLALAFGSEPHFDYPLNTVEDLAVEDRSDYPAGCVVEITGWVKYNRGAGGGNDNYKLVCNTTDGAAFYDGAGSRLCPRKRFSCRGTCDSAFDFGQDKLYNPYFWSEESCRPKAQVFYDGRVSLVTPPSKYDDGAQASTRPQINSGNWFRVRWANGHAPTPTAGVCPSHCEPVQYITGESCVCSINVATSAVFTDTSAVPTQAEVEEELRIGAPSPFTFDADTYSLCTSPSCQAAGPAVKVYTRGEAEAPRFDETAIFEISVNVSRPGAGRTLHLANKASIVSIGENVYEQAEGVGGWGGDCTCPDGSVYQVGDVDGSACGELACYGGKSGPCKEEVWTGAGKRVTCGYAFRNPPVMMTLTDPTQRDAIYETEALFEHIFYHPNIAPFVSYRLIQRLVTSNPSPRYVAAVAAAFRTGEYFGLAFSGKHGDLGATVAAILLDREARSLLLLSDPTHGHLREPLVKLIHLLRAMEFQIRDAREIELGGAGASLALQIGQGLFEAPTVSACSPPPHPLLIALPLCSGTDVCHPAGLQLLRSGLCVGGADSGRRPGRSRGPTRCPPLPDRLPGRRALARIRRPDLLQERPWHHVPDAHVPRPVEWAQQRRARLRALQPLGRGAGRGAQPCADWRPPRHAGQGLRRCQV